MLKSVGNCLIHGIDCFALKYIKFICIKLLSFMEDIEENISSNLVYEILIL